MCFGFKTYEVKCIIKAQRAGWQNRSIVLKIPYTVHKMIYHSNVDGCISYLLPNNKLPHNLAA